MKNNGKSKDQLPESFATEEEAGEFWDAHSIMDYVEYLEPVNDRIVIKKRTFQVQVAEDIFERLQQQATVLHQSVPTLVDQILRQTLVAQS